jgi:uncharacterized spore protein YtfJ
MTEETLNLNDIDAAVDHTAAHFAETMEGFMGKASPSTVFSEPEVVGDDIVFAAAAFERAGGFGFGSGRGHDPQGGTGGGGGGGGGGMSRARPVAVIRVGSRGIEVRPVLDVTRIGVTIILAAVGIGRTLRRT